MADKITERRAAAARKRQVEREKKAAAERETKEEDVKAEAKALASLLERLAAQV